MTLAPILEIVESMVGFYLVASAICWVLASASCAAYVARSKGFSALVWFSVGALLPLVGVVAAAGLPDRKRHLRRTTS